MKFLTFPDFFAEKYTIYPDQYDEFDMISPDFFDFSMVYYNRNKSSLLHTVHTNSMKWKIRMQARSNSVGWFQKRREWYQPPVIPPQSTTVRNVQYNEWVRKKWNINNNIFLREGSWNPDFSWPKWVISWLFLTFPDQPLKTPILSWFIIPYDPCYPTLPYSIENLNCIFKIFLLGQVLITRG